MASTESLKTTIGTNTLAGEKASEIVNSSRHEQSVGAPVFMPDIVFVADYAAGERELFLQASGILRLKTGGVSGPIYVS
jgi:hypothetical protein